MLLLTLEVLTQGLREEVVAGHHTHEHRDVGRETRLSPESEPTHRRATARAPRTTRARRPTRPHTRTIDDVELKTRSRGARITLGPNKRFLQTRSLAAPFHTTRCRVRPSPSRSLPARAARDARDESSRLEISTGDFTPATSSRSSRTPSPRSTRSPDAKKISSPRAHPVFPNVSARRCIGGASNMLSGEGGLFPGPSGSPQHTRKHGYAGSCRAPNHR